MEFLIVLLSVPLFLLGVLIFTLLVLPGYTGNETEPGTTSIGDLEIQGQIQPLQWD